VQPEIRRATLGPWTKDVADRYLTSPFTLLPAATGYSNLRNTYERALVIIAVIVALVLLVGCVNITNLLLARAISRRHEFSLRLALGASRARLVRQLLVESLVLSAGGTALGVLIAACGSAFLVRQLSTPTTFVFLDVAIDRRVLAFTVATTMVTALLFGTGPALRASRLQPMGAIEQQGRASIEHGSSALMGWLLAVQVALSVVLVVAAGLFVGSFISLVHRPLGVDPRQLLVVTVDPQNKVAVPQRVALYERVREAVTGLPNVATAAISNLTPLGGGGFTPAVEISAHSRSGEPRARQVVPANQDVFGNLVSPGWFGTFGTRLVAGRDFAATDRHGARAPRSSTKHSSVGFSEAIIPSARPLWCIRTRHERSPRRLSAWPRMPSIRRRGMPRRRSGFCPSRSSTCRDSPSRPRV
jgi:putative ABC transport system permease protein